MNRIIAKHYYLINIVLFIFIIVLLTIPKINEPCVGIFYIVSFLLLYIIHDEEIHKIGKNTHDIQYIMREMFNKELTDEELTEIFNKEYNKYFNIRSKEDGKNNS